MRRITSRRNPLVAQYRAVAGGQTPSLMLLDGVHLVQDAVFAGVRLHHLAIDASSASNPDIASIAAQAAHAGADVVEVTGAVMAALSPVRSTGAIVALAERPNTSSEALFHAPPSLVVAAIGVQDPGNLGAIVRAAEAGGASGVIVTGASADPFGWKALRGSMGSAFRCPVAREATVASLVAQCRAHGSRILATVPRGGTDLYATTLTDSCALFIGAEGPGLPREAIDAAEGLVSIPMTPAVESLNAATCAALLVYEARRQRQAQAAAPHSAHGFPLSAHA